MNNNTRHDGRMAFEPVALQQSFEASEPKVLIAPIAPTGFVVRDTLAGKDYPFLTRPTAENEARNILRGESDLPVSVPSDINAYNIKARDWEEVTL